MKQQEIKDLICEMGYDEVLLFEDPCYDSAFVGLSEDNRAVYDYDLMVEYLVENDGMEPEEAMEFIDYNTIRALPYYENHPIVFTKIE